MARIAVTGASGFVGRHVVAALEVHGHEVRALNRRGSPGIDVRDASAVSAALARCELVVHFASSWDPDDDIEAVTVAGTENVIHAARNAGVQRVVFVSCLGAEAASHSVFYRARWEAETLLRGSGVPYTIVRPSLVLGKDDGLLAPLARMVRLFPVIPVPRRDAPRVQPIDVDDLARCLEMVLTSPELENQTVSLGGPIFTTFRQLLDLIGGEVGVQKPKLALPDPLLRRAVSLLPAWACEVYGPARFARFQTGVVASPGVVEHYFGFSPASPVEVIRRSLA